MGVHPQFVDQYSADEWVVVLNDLEGAFFRNTPPKAVGEIGLHRGRGAQETRQETRFVQQLSIARALDVPVILHVVGLHHQSLAILKDLGPLPAGGVVHGFTGSKEIAQQYLELGLHLGISGRWVAGGAKKLERAIADIDLSRLLLESDAPDQSPHVGERNESTVILSAAAWLAERKGLTKKSVLVQCSKNAVSLFG